MNKTIATCLVITCIGGWSSVPAADERHVLRFGVAAVSPSESATEPVQMFEDLGDGTAALFDGGMTVELVTSSGLAIEYEYRWSKLIGIDVGLLRTNHDLDVRLDGHFTVIDSDSGEVLFDGPIDETETIGDVTMTPMTVGVSFHVTNRSKVDVYVGPLVGYVFYGELKSSGETTSVKDDFTYGILGGIDAPLGKGKWILGGGLRYLQTEATLEDPELGQATLDVNPWVLQVYAGVRF